MEIKQRNLTNSVILPISKDAQNVLELIFQNRSASIPLNGYQLNWLHNPNTLNGLDKAVGLLANSLSNNSTITLVGDFDADGATSTALSILALKAMGAKMVHYLIPSRFSNGYGLSPALVEEAHRLGSSLILTVDNGISAFEGIVLAKELGIKVIVTDHHLPGEKIPDADAIINPNLPYCQFPSKNLAGVGVAFYLMSALRAHLRTINWFETNQLTEPNLANFLDLVALGTVADVVPLDENNRILVYQGLERIKAGKCRPGIAALLQVASKDITKLNAKDLGFVLGPRLNAAGRLDDMSIGVELLICDNPIKASELAAELDLLNESRKEIELSMQTEAIGICDVLAKENSVFPSGIALFHEEWHQGIVGLLASRIKEKFHRPVFAFAPAEEEGKLKGSGRSISGVHLRDVLERMQTIEPGLIDKFGGHAMAAGLTLSRDNFSRFELLFNEVIQKWVDPSDLKGVIWTDGELSPELMNIEVAKLLNQSGPWGQGFPEPAFDGVFKILQQRMLKEKHLKLTLEPVISSNGSDTRLKPLIDAIAFNVDTTIWPDASIKQVKLVYKLDINYFRGEENLQLMIDYIEPA
ncbi:single-stranded-DNA-specific exonuclease RecJ [Thorsellia anophelis]|uniref:Single-stranded-DNA-specific exonuclease RecJ n=1 Tax=Thorsellia anophelis DSM 18579 TaxID=1123402 RepID=A0A1I0FIE5_9GAMM|nr:single-stranded-DNA-specific exonuclease RecJ [Thorsellia anophelis]SET58101.1 single-stranded-DNA-specific exonuclease [Thorsellia anophelis DSM 18579]